MRCLVSPGAVLPAAPVLLSADSAPAPEERPRIPLFSLSPGKEKGGRRGSGGESSCGSGTQSPQSRSLAVPEVGLVREKPLHVSWLGPCGVAGVRSVGVS